METNTKNEGTNDNGKTPESVKGFEPYRCRSIFNQVTIIYAIHKTKAR